MAQGPPKSIGPFQVLRELGRGGMGAVFEVLQPDTGRRMALKLVLGAEEILLRRFQREVEVMARVEHPNVVHIVGCGEAAEGPWLLAELVEGEDLASCVRTRGPFPPGEAARIVADLADALAAVHAAGIVHRDLKPSNAMLRPDGSPVLLDFGLARDDLGERLTRSAAFLGTPGYMAPEQLGERKEVGTWTDIYALGGVLVFLLTGRPPFGEAVSNQALIKKLLSEQPVWPSVDHPQTPAALDAICRRAMARDPAERYPSAAELCAALRGWDQPGATPATGRGRVLAGVGLVLALAAGGLFAWRSTGGAAPATVPPVEPKPSVATVPTPPRPLAEPVGGWPALIDPGQEKEPHPKEVQVAFVEARRAITWGDPSREVLGWNLEDPAQPRLETSLRLAGPVQELALDGSLTRGIAAASGAGIVLFDLQTRHTRDLGLELQGDSVSAVAISSKGDRIAVASWHDPPDDPQARSGWIQVWEAAGEEWRPFGQPLRTSPEHANELLFVPGRPWLVAACGNSSAGKIDLATGRCRLYHLEGGSPPVESAEGVVQSQGMTMAALGSELLAVGDSADRVVLLRLPGLESIDPALDQLEGVEARGPTDGVEQLKRVGSHSGALRSMTWDGERLWSLSGEYAKRKALGNELRGWSRDGKNQSALLRGTAFFTSVAVSPDGELLLIGHGEATGRAELWLKRALPTGFTQHPRRSYEGAR